MKERRKRKRAEAEAGPRAKRRAIVTWGAFQKAKDFLAGAGAKKVPGSARVYVFLKRNLKPKGSVLIESHGNMMYADARDEGVLPLLLDGGIYEEFETELFKGLLKPGMVVVDIGANIGHYSLIAARLVGDSGHVYSFEPDPHNFDLLRRNIEMNGFKNVTPVNKALSNEPGTLTLHLDKYNLGGHSLTSDNILIDAGTVEVETTTLDLFFISSGGGDRIDVMKMDTQGSEGTIVEGARRLMEENDLAILMELWPFGLRNAGYDPATLVVNLDRLGFSFKVIDNNGEEARETDAAGVIEMCSGMRESVAHVNLFLEK